MAHYVIGVVFDQKREGWVIVCSFDVHCPSRDRHIGSRHSSCWTLSMARTTVANPITTLFQIVFWGFEIAFLDLQFGGRGRSETFGRVQVQLLNTIFKNIIPPPQLYPRTIAILGSQCHYCLVTDQSIQLFDVPTVAILDCVKHISDTPHNR